MLNNKAAFSGDFCILIFKFVKDFVIGISDFGWDDRCGGAMMHRYIRDIDKRKPAVIINPSYFGKFPNLPIDKIDI